MLRIYTSDHSLYCAKLRILLRHKQIPFEEAPPPGGGGSAEYLSIVPSGNIPALVDGDLVLTDSEAIAEYLEEKFPDRPMLPDTLIGRALSRERSRFSDTRLEPALRLTFPHVAPAARDQVAIEEAHAMITKRLSALGVMLARFGLPRDRLWMGDCGTIVTLEWIALFEGPVIPTLVWPDEVTTYRAQMLAHAAVADEMTAYRPEMLHYMHQKGAI
ncbi:glutathione S-transferase family protein [Marivita sp.]|uniref:glutathione S-transferase family protein n=1 Tax=Marivita sp. TaxID=2003365 RepID=UPI002618C0CD|nr:glutathione S-transferase family protein [Marivita sp.]